MELVENLLKNIKNTITENLEVANVKVIYNKQSSYNVLFGKVYTEIELINNLVKKGIELSRIVYEKEKWVITGITYGIDNSAILFVGKFMKNEMLKFKFLLSYDVLMLYSKEKYYSIVWQVYKGNNVVTQANSFLEFEWEFVKKKIRRELEYWKKGTFEINREISGILWHRIEKLEKEGLELLRKTED